jgi:hypothetical protein
MRDSNKTKALFRCVFAYSNGEPVTVFDVDGRQAFANKNIALKVAVSGDVTDEDFEGTEWTEQLSAAYDLFIVDPEAAEKLVQWVRPEVTQKSRG